MKALRFSLATLRAGTLIMAVSCVSLNSVSLTQIPKNRSTRIKGEASKFLFFGLSFDNDYVDEVNRALISGCQNGKIQGILTKHFYTNYFLGIFARSTVEAEGFCVKEQKKA